MISMLAVALTMSNPAASMPQVKRPGSIRGFVRARADGYRMECRGILLIPRTEAVDEQIRLYFGALDDGVRPVSYEELQRRRSESETPATGAREQSCRGFAGFGFRDVPPGSYYLVATMALDPRHAYGDAPGGRSGSGLDLMRRVEIRPGATVKVDIKKD